MGSADSAKQRRPCRVDEVVGYLKIKRDMRINCVLTFLEIEGSPGSRRRHLHIKFRADYFFAAGGRLSVLCSMEMCNLVKSILICITACFETGKLSCFLLGPLRGGVDYLLM